MTSMLDWPCDPRPLDRVSSDTPIASVSAGDDPRTPAAASDHCARERPVRSTVMEIGTHDGRAYELRLAVFPPGFLRAPRTTPAHLLWCRYVGDGGIRGALMS